MKIRLATKEDIPTILEIYREYIKTPITFEYELPSKEKFTQEFSENHHHYPYLVGEVKGVICGYAYAHKFKERVAYKWGAELSIYLSQKKLGQGLGRKLYETLIEILKKQGYKTVYGCITLPNEKSEALHQKLGFRDVGIFHQSGFKNDVWHGVIWYEKVIGNMKEIPREPIEVEKVLACEEE
ncbi:MAG TPA: GNAT family N-acetyltransferase [Candidatus Dorea intestinavium]|nr:GNAT family N-acetyltransferase [Candidatus Dorea intestinavium]